MKEEFNWLGWLKVPYFEGTCGHWYKMIRRKRKLWKEKDDIVVQSLSCIWLFATPWTVACQAPLSSTLSQSLLKFMSIEAVMLSDHFILATHLFFCLQPLPGSFPMSWLFASGGQSVGTATSVSVLQWIFRVYFLSDWLVCSPCYSKNSQKSSPTPQFKSIDSLVISLLYGSSLTSVHDNWKNHSFDYTDLCQQSDASAF